MNNVIPFIKPQEIEPCCSFCGMPKTKAKKFFESGNGKYICNQCVIQAKQRLQESS